MEPIRVLIVDDDKYIRADIRQLIAWEASGYRLAGEASNGQEALRMLGEQPVDVLITDICMPVMDGIELIRDAKSRNPDLQVLVLSNFDDFEFVKEAMKLGAADYMLKYQLDKDNLLALLGAVRQVIVRLQEEKAVAAEEREKVFWRELLAAAGESAREIEARVERFDPEWLKMGVLPLLVWSSLPEDEWAGRCAEAFKSREVHYAQWSPGCYAVMAFFFNPSQLYMNERVEELVRFVERQNGGKCVIIARGDYAVPIARLPEVLPRLERAIDRYFYEGPGKRIFLVGLGGKSKANEAGALQSGREAEREAHAAAMMRELEAVNAFSYVQALEQFCREMCEAAIPLPQAMKEWNVFAYQLAVRLKKSDTFPKEAIDSFRIEFEAMQPPFVTLEQLKDLFRKYGEAFIANRSASVRSLHPDIDKAIAYLRVHFRENISLETISRHVQLSRNHFCALFKEEMGVNYKEYVNRQRVREAKWMLAKGEHTVQEVSDAVGIGNYRYFCKLFRRHTGMNPSEFRRKGAVT